MPWKGKFFFTEHLGTSTGLAWRRRYSIWATTEESGAQNLLAFGGSFWHPFVGPSRGPREVELGLIRTISSLTTVILKGWKSEKRWIFFDVIRPDLVRFARRHWRMSLTGCQVVGKLQSLMPPTQQGNSFIGCFHKERSFWDTLLASLKTLQGEKALFPQAKKRATSLKSGDRNGIQALFCWVNMRGRSNNWGKHQVCLPCFDEK